MRSLDDLPFREVWALDFEFSAPPGERPAPHTLVAHELKSGRVVQLFGDELRRCKAPPYDLSDDCLFVAFYSSAEWGCHLALGWPLPRRILDLFTEFRCMTNGLDTPCGSRLLGALAAFGLPALDAAEKEEMRALAIRGDPYTSDEARSLLAYCESDVVSLERLLPAMLPRIDLPRALLRGRYMAAAARMEDRGVPIDVEAHRTLVENWDRIKVALVERIDRDFGVFDSTSFRTDRWADYLSRHEIPWPRLASGRLALDDDTFRQMARAHPQIAPVRELRHALSELRLAGLAVGRDGRNRTILSAFRARTSRNQPSNARFIFGPAVWLRGLIQAEPGYAIAYVDWGQQEFGIAAALSGDANMLDAYQSGDPYLAFAMQAGRIPPGGTKATHGTERELFKQCALAVQYGMEADSLAARIGAPTIVARDLLRLHRTTYRRFWEWVDGAVDFAMCHGYLHTVFGWPIRLRPSRNEVEERKRPRMLRNFLMQGNGAEMLRLACCYATEAGIGVCAPVHDALLPEAPSDAIDETVAATQAAMAHASRDVLGGFELRSDVGSDDDRKVWTYPDRYQDERGRAMWETVWSLLSPAQPCAGGPPGPAHQREAGPLTDVRVTRSPVQHHPLTGARPVPSTSSLMGSTPTTPTTTPDSDGD